jgi:undecaprenyl-diphosphatase
MEEAAENILPYERDIFLTLNNSHSDFFDYFMVLFSSVFIWIPLVIVIIFSLIYKTKWQEALLVIIAFVLLIILCDQISASIIKPLFSRLRPSRHPDFENFVTIIDGYRVGRYGFISSHATNSFGIAVFSSLLFRYRFLSVTIFLWAIINSYSRIYLGVHFISDIVGGIIIGSLLGLFTYYLYSYARCRFLHIPKSEKHIPIFGHLRAQFIIGALIALVLTIIIISLLALSY